MARSPGKVLEDLWPPVRGVFHSTAALTEDTLLLETRYIPKYDTL
jgi:hypothetical protein